MINKNIIFFIIISGSFKIFSTKIISIGQSCSVALILRELGLRKEAYPFDWIISPFESLYQAINDDFKSFLQEGYFKIRLPDRFGILDYYGFHFVHDFPTIIPNIPLENFNPEIDNIIDKDHISGGVLVNNWRDFISTVKDKYSRRINRLIYALLGNEKVYLIRHFDITKQEAIKLRDLLNQKYPQLDFTLIIVGNSDEMKDDWKLDKIKVFYLTSKDQWNDIINFIK